ncbi:MAG TPA: carboxypeptidase-like regulatory domain-containing protein, partial [Longimicrobiales bacterium]
AQNGATLTGRVFADDTLEPLAGALVQIRALGIGTLADSAGRFELRGVPPGRHDVSAQLIGYHMDLQVVEVAGTERVAVEFFLVAQAIQVSGLPRPTPVESRLAAPLVPQLLADPEVLRFIREHTRQDTVTVWVEWKPDGDTLLLGSEPLLRVVRDCPECVAKTWWTIDATGYEAAAGHVLVGVDIGRHRAAYYVSIIRPGDAVKHHGGWQDTTIEVVNFRQADGGWVRMPATAARSHLH